MPFLNILPEGGKICLGRFVFTPVGFHLLAFCFGFPFFWVRTLQSKHMLAHYPFFFGATLLGAYIKKSKQKVLDQRTPQNYL